MLPETVETVFDQKTISFAQPFAPVKCAYPGSKALSLKHLIKWKIES